MSTAHSNVVMLSADRDDSEPPLLPDGEYRLSFSRHRIVNRFGRDVLELWFTVADYGEHFGKKLARYYAIRASDKRRNFTARPGSDFVREYTRTVGCRPRFGVASLGALERGFVVARVGATTTDHRQQPLAKELHYSTIRELIRREGG